MISLFPCILTICLTALSYIHTRGFLFSQKHKYDSFQTKVCGVEFINALDDVGLESLHERRETLCLKFAKKAVKHSKHSKWFVPNARLATTRQEQDKFCPVYAKHKRFDDSPISYLTKLLNSDR